MYQSLGSRGHHIGNKGFLPWDFQVSEIWRHTCHAESAGLFTLPAAIAEYIAGKSIPTPRVCLGDFLKKLSRWGIRLADSSFLEVLARRGFASYILARQRARTTGRAGQADISPE